MDEGSVHEQRAIVIAGPTASGKSALALAVAERLGGVVINADSMQVYADLRILTARPSDEEMARVPHRLFGHVDAADAYSVGRWLADMQQALEESRAARKTPVIAGGTGLYLRALTQGLAPMPDIPPTVRAEVRQRAEEQTSADLHAELVRRDPVMATRLRPTDRQRIVRALEVFAATGRSLAIYQSLRSDPLLPAARFSGVFLAPDRQRLNAAIERRFDAMVQAGVEAEVERLARRSLDPALPAMKALGLQPFLAYRAGHHSLADAIVDAKHATRQYARRQFTFGRHQLPTFQWIDPDQADVEGIVGAIGSAPPDKVISGTV